MEFRHPVARGRPAGASLEAMYEVMLAYGHSLSLDHQGFSRASGPLVLIIEKQQGPWGPWGQQ